MLAILPVILALAAQPSPAPADDGPLATAPREAVVETEAPATAAPGLDEPVVVPSAPEAAPAPPDSEAEAQTAPAGRTGFDIEARTKVEGETLQVVLGQRAVFRLDDKGWPVLLAVEDGQLAAAHPEGKVQEVFGPPSDGQIAVALDGSADVRATILKVWNETDRAVDYRAIALVFSGGKVSPSPAPVCAVPPRSIRIETWRRPIVAAGLGRFKESVTPRACQ